MEELKLGDVVYLKSGSTAMVISYMDGDDCECTWHDDKKINHRMNYPAAILTKEDPNKPSISTIRAKRG